MVNPLKGAALVDLYKPLALNDRTGQDAEKIAAYSADHLAAVLSARNLRIALAALASWKRG